MAPSRFSVKDSIILVGIKALLEDLTALITFKQIGVIFAVSLLYSEKHSYNSFWQLEINLENLDSIAPFSFWYF
jgi:hypothetical protein